VKDDWQDLGRGDRFQIALAVARRRGAAWVRAYDNVVSTGAGFRLSGDREERVDEICLCFLVRRKWSTLRERPQKIPSFIVARPVLRGRRLFVRIPTDVSKFKGGAPQAIQDMTRGVTSRLNGNRLDFGSTCCQVRNARIAEERYLLTCFHAFSSSLRRPPQDGLDCEADDGTFLGPLDDTADPTGSSAVDAALVRLTNAAIDDISLWGFAPSTRATDFDLENLALRGDLFVLARQVAPAAGGLPALVRSGPLAATFTKVITSSTAYAYGPGRSFSFADTIEYKAAVRPGDSGSALVDTAGMLYGMHFYGRGEFGYALSAPRLFDPEVFSLDIVI
jgi:hypothetical protein